MAEKKTSKKEPSFEASIERVEEILKEMEAGQIGLDQMMAHYEEGMKTVKACTDKLNEVEKKIEQLSEKNGEIETEPFDSDLED